ncbi:aldo/keto reductase [Ilumatobacter sp.]|uniref:aldo/keto reductase n=1 Tax=Ilumatobacter sp. TaxID=1967498 RepID=UPI003B5163EE
MSDAHPSVGEADSSEHDTVGRGEPGATPAVTSRGSMSMPRLGFGTYELEPDDAERMVTAALDVGFRHVDTAQMYGNEEAVGRAIAASGVSADDVFVTTKVSNDHHEPHALQESVERSIERLGLEHVDLLLIHWPVDFDRVSATLAALENVHAAGLTRHIGVSNFTVEQLDEVASMAPLEALQVECHPFFRQDELRRWCRDHDWAFTAYSPIARGEVFDDEVMAEIAERHDCTPSAAALAWLLTLDGVAAIPRTGDVDHLRDNWSAREIELDADALDAIAGLDERRLVDPAFSPW